MQNTIELLGNQTGHPYYEWSLDAEYQRVARPSDRPYRLGMATRCRTQRLGRPSDRPGRLGLATDMVCVANSTLTGVLDKQKITDNL